MFWAYFQRHTFTGVISMFYALVLCTAMAREASELPADLWKLRFQTQGDPDQPTACTATGPGYGVVLNREGIEIIPYAPPGQELTPIKMTFRNGHSLTNPMVRNLTKGHFNSLVGNDPSQWRRRVPLYERAGFTNIYDGIDVEIYGADGILEYDLIIQPGADPSVLQIEFSGAEGLAISPEGALTIRTASGTVIQNTPTVYQLEGDTRIPVHASFRLIDDTCVTFDLQDYDPHRELVIDPPITFSTYLGGPSEIVDLSDKDFADDLLEAICVDDQGNAYVTGWIWSLPRHHPREATESRGAYPLTHLADSVNAFFHAAVYVTAFNSDGEFLYSTAFGSPNTDYGKGICVDAETNIYVTGCTFASGFPTTNGFQTNMVWGNGVAFLTKLTPGGDDVLYSTYIGGSGHDEGTAVAVDSNGIVYVTGHTYSSDFPTTNALYATPRGDTSTGRKDAFVARIDTTKTGADSLLYSTYFGGYRDEWPEAIAVDQMGNAYIAGLGHPADDFPLLNEISCPKVGCRIGFLFKLSPTCELMYSTYLRGSGDGTYSAAHGVAINAAGHCFVAGAVDSENLPTPGAYRNTLSGPEGWCDGFLLQINTAVAGVPGVLYGTYFGSDFPDVFHGVAISDSGRVFVCGHMYDPAMTGFPLKGFNTELEEPLRQRCSFVAAFNTMNTGEDSLVYSTAIGGSDDDTTTGIAVDGGGNAYVTGYTESLDFPAISAFQDEHTAVDPVAVRVQTDGFIYRLSAPISGTALPVPDGGSGTFLIPRVALASIAVNPADCRPVAMDGSDNNQYISVLIPPFKDNVDVHLHLELDGGTSTGLVFMVTSNRTVVTRSVQQPDLVPFITSTKGNRYFAIGPLIFTQLPPGQHSLALIITPAGSTDFSSSYRWEVDLSEDDPGYVPVPETNHLVTATSTAHGSIYPSGNIMVPEGRALSFHILADSLYEIQEILHDGVPVPFPDNSEAYVELFDIRTNATLHVNFTEQTTTQGTPLWWLADYGWTNDFETWDQSDTDQDSYRVWQEWVANTDPTRKESALQILSIHNAADGARTVIWQSSSNRDYVVTWRPTVMEEGTELPYRVSGDPPINAYTDTVLRTDSSGFYTLEAQMP